LPAALWDQAMRHEELKPDGSRGTGAGQEGDGAQEPGAGRDRGNKSRRRDTGSRVRPRCRQDTGSTNRCGLKHRGNSMNPQCLWLKGPEGLQHVLEKNVTVTWPDRNFAVETAAC